MNESEIITVNGYDNTEIFTVELMIDIYSGWPHSSQDKIPCVFPVLENFSLCYFYVINNSIWGICLPCCLCSYSITIYRSMQTNFLKCVLKC